jgi:hypothetical protein
VAYGVDQRAGDLRAGRVAAGVRDAAAVVPALAGQLYLAGAGVGVEAGPGLDETPHGGGALGHERTDGLLVAQARSGDEGVVEVLVGGVALAERGGYAALGPAGGAVVEPGLGDDDRTETRGVAAERGGQPGDAGADDHDVRVDAPAGRGGGERGGVPGHRSAPSGRGMLSMSRVLPTRAATASTASAPAPAPASAPSSKSAPASLPFACGVVPGVPDSPARSVSSVKSAGSISAK